MSVLDFVADDLFVVRIVKYLASNPDNKWTNSYELRANEALDTTALVGFAGAALLLEQALHHSSVRFDRTIISTWEADSKPYDPEAFLVIPLAVSGSFGGLADLISLDKTLSVARVPASGRVGHLFYRACLLEDQVSAPAGKSILTDIDEEQVRVDNAITLSEIDTYFSASTLAPLTMVMIDSVGANVRGVKTLTVKGVGTVPTDHAWFNRPPATPS